MYVPFLLIGIAILKKKSIRAQFGLRHSIYALVVKITLFWIGKVSISFGAIKTGWNIEFEYDKCLKKNKY